MNSPMDKIVSEEQKKVQATIRVSKDEVSLKEYKPFNIITLEKSYHRGKAGEPSLPWRKYYASIPWDAIPRKLKINDVAVVPLATKVYVEPYQPNVPDTGKMVEWVRPNSQIYVSDEIYPKDFIRIGGIRRIGGFAMAEIEVCPFRYYPHSKRLELIERLDLSLIYIQKGIQLKKSRSITALRQERKSEERVKGLVINPEHVPRYRSSELPTTCDLSINVPTVDYLIITTEDLAEGFNKLAKWRTMMGLNAKVITLEQIKNNKVPDTQNANGEYPKFNLNIGYHDGGTRDEQEMIRNFIKWASINWFADPTSGYVLLGGDVEKIPGRKALCVGEEDQNIEGKYRIAVSYSKIKNLNHNFPNAPHRVDSKTTRIQIENIEGDWGFDRDDQIVFISKDSQNKTIFSYNSTANSAYPGWYFVKDLNGGFSEKRTDFIEIRGNEDYLGKNDPHFIIIPNDAYRIDDFTTRIHLAGIEWWAFIDYYRKVIARIAIAEKSHAAISYKRDANADKLGWYFVRDLKDGGIADEDEMTDFIEIRGPSEYHGSYNQDKSHFLIQEDQNYFETDLYYSDIDIIQYPSSDKHDWDADGNGIYGEVFLKAKNGEKFSGWDEVNGFPDIHVGRAPVKTSNDVKVFVDKIICYETYKEDPELGINYPPDFAVSILLASQNLGAIGEDPATPLLDRSAMANERLRSRLLEIDPSRWNFSRLYEGSSNVINKDQGSDLIELSNLPITKLNSVLAKGHNALNIICHGDPGNLGGILSRSQLKDIENIPGIIFGCACSTARFDDNWRDPKTDNYAGSLGECTILKPKGGAVAYIGATRMSSTGDWPMTVDFWAEWPKSERLFQMFDAAQLNYCNSSSTPNYNWNLLGDPAMRVWSDRPQQMNVVHTSKVCKGYQTFGVNVTCKGNPVKDALVCLTMEDPTTKQTTLFATAKTDESGNVYRTIIPSATGKLIVAVSAKNMIPYIGQSTVKECESKCSSKLICNNRIVSWGDLFEHCKNQLGIICKPQIAFACISSVSTCPSVNPIDIDWEDIYTNWIDTIIKPEYLYSIWGIRDIGEFIKRADTPEIKKTLEEMPAGFRKPIMQMIKRIKYEKKL